MEEDSILEPQTDISGGFYTRLCHHLIFQDIMPIDDSLSQFEF